MPFTITMAAPLQATAAIAAAVATTQAPPQYVYEPQCYYVPVTHVYVFEVYQTMELECQYVPKQIK